MVYVDSFQSWSQSMSLWWIWVVVQMSGVPDHPNGPPWFVLPSSTCLTGLAVVRKRDHNAVHPPWERFAWIWFCRWRSVTVDFIRPQITSDNISLTIWINIFSFPAFCFPESRSRAVPTPQVLTTLQRAGWHARNVWLSLPWSASVKVQRGGGQVTVEEIPRQSFQFAELWGVRVQSGWSVRVPQRWRRTGKSTVGVSGEKHVLQKHPPGFSLGWSRF